MTSLSKPSPLPTLAEFDGLIIDLDGTLIDTLADFVAALNGMLADLHLQPVAAAVVERFVGKGSEHLITQVLGLQLTAEQVATLYPQAWALYQQHYLAINGLHSSVYPGVIEGLDGFAGRNLKLACLTNKPLAFAAELLRKKGLDGYFLQVFGGDSFEQKKPHPQPVLGTCAALGLEPAQVLCIGDSSNDAYAAHAAGCQVVLVSYGYNHGQSVRAMGFAWGAVPVVDSFAELLT